MLYAFDPRLPFVAAFVSYITLFIAGSFSVEVPRVRSSLSNNAHIVATLRCLRRTPVIVYAFMAFIIVELLGEAMWTAYQPLYSNDGWSVPFIGVLFSLIAALSAISAYAVRHIMRRLGALHIQLILSCLMLMGVLFLNMPTAAGRILSVIPTAVAFGMAGVPLKAIVQKMIERKYHSTALSVISVLQYVVYAVASLFVSGLIDVFGDDHTRRLLLIYGVIGSLVVVWIYTHNRRLDMAITEK